MLQEAAAAAATVAPPLQPLLLVAVAQLEAWAAACPPCSPQFGPLEAGPAGLSSSMRLAQQEESCTLVGEEGQALPAVALLP